MRMRLLVVTCAFMLAACGSGTGPGGGGPPSAQTVAANDGDWSGLQKCPESGSWDSYLASEKTKSPDQYQTDKKSWDDLKAAGANDSYIAVYSGSASHCGEFGLANPGGTPGKVAYVYAVRFKDSSSAAASYKSTSKDFNLSDSSVSQLKAAGATVSEGSATGLGGNSVEVNITVVGTSFFIGFWQNKDFEVAVVTLNVQHTADAAAKINGRIQ